jgi:hypothetical protein
MINSFSQYLVEEERVVYFTFGRMNPPTMGHGKLLDVLSSKAGSNTYKIYLSQTQDPKKNPLSYSDKVKHVRKMFPKHGRSVMINKNVKTAIDAMTLLYNEGFRKVVFVVGSDRVREFDVLLNKYNGKKSRHGFYNFKSIDVISAGARDPDAEGVEGMSASKQRDNASKNDFTSFAQGLPRGMSNNDSRRLFNDVRKGMGLKEQSDFKRHVQLDSVSETREKFVSGNLFELGESVIVKKTDEVGTITVLGSNYVIVETAERKTRQWLDAVEKIEEKTLTPAELKKREKVAKSIERDNPSMPMDKKMAIATSVAKKTAEEYSPQKHEEGTPAAAAHARKLTPGQPKEGNGLWANMHAKKARGEKMRKKGAKGAPTPDQIQRAQESQDPDIKDREGTQPARYHTGLSKATKIARDRHFQAKKAGPAPGDANAKTKPSKHTTFVRKMMGEADTRVDIAKSKIEREKEADKKKHDRMMDRARLNDTKKRNMQEYGGPPISRKDYMKKKSAGIGYNSVQEASFADKSKASGISVDTLKKVYQRGVAAWKTGHRPGTNPTQWGHARVNAFIRKKKQGGLNHDKDLA